MDIGQMDKDGSHRCSEDHHGEAENADESWKDDWPHQESCNQDQGEMFAMAKGNAMGKRVKGKGNGKGKSQVVCYNCQQPGHIAVNCPNSPVKGKGIFHRY